MLTTDDVAKVYDTILTIPAYVANCKSLILGFHGRFLFRQIVLLITPILKLLKNKIFGSN